MAEQRKLGKATDIRIAMLRNQVSYFLWNGKLETTFARAKEVQKLAEKYISLAVGSYKDVENVSKVKVVKGVDTKINVVNDGKEKLKVRRYLMAHLYDIQETKGDKESKMEYLTRTKEVSHPLLEKIFNEYAPKYAKRAEELGQAGGYTAIYRIAYRRGDAAEMALLQLL
ncbi:MAG: 50S ribosomal protein L17 [Clostridia bacterium]